MDAHETMAQPTEPVPKRVLRVAAWIGGIAVVLVLLNLLGIPVRHWVNRLLNNVRSVPAGAIVAGVALETVQTVFAALSWVTILRAAFPDTQIGIRPVVAAYAVAVGLNSFLPGNIGTIVMMVMFVTLIASATFASILSGFVVQKIPFTIFSLATYLYLFATVGGSLSFEFGFLAKHPVLSALIAVGAVVLLVLVCRIIWRHATKLREQIKNGGAVLGEPRRFMVGVFAPQLVSYAARIAIVAVFLAAYSIPVTFHTTMAVTAANSISKSVSVTPGGAGVTQALNVVVLQSVTSTDNATAYSVAQQLIISAWDILFAIVMVAWVFGWSGGKTLVKESYAQASVKRQELKQQRAARRGPRTHRWRRHRAGP